MTAEQSLLDLMSIQMGCMYLSDLRFCHRSSAGIWHKDWSG